MMRYAIINDRQTDRLSLFFYSVLLHIASLNLRPPEAGIFSRAFLSCRMPRSPTVFFAFIKNGKEAVSAQETKSQQGGIE